MRRIRTAIAAVLVSATLVTGLAACADQEQDRWCERDATDRRVADYHCENGERGYEWETDDSHGHGSKHKKHKNSTSGRSSRR